MRLERRMRCRRSTVRVPWLRDATRQQLCLIWLADHNLRFGMFVGKRSRNTLQCSARPIARHPIVQPLSREIVEYLKRCCTGMKIGIGFILELPGHVPAVLLGKLDGLGDHADSPLGGGSYDHFRSKEPHELPPLDAKWLCHGDHKRVSLAGADHGKADSGISPCRLNDRLARLKLSGLFGRLDHPQSQSVLDGTKRVEGFNFYEKIHAL